MPQQADTSILPGDWEHDHVNFPLLNHVMLSGMEKFEAMLEVFKAIDRVDDFLFTSHGDIP